MGYFNTRGFQGWWRLKDGTRIHGNELNSLELIEYVLSILSNTGRNEDVAVLGGGLMREYLRVEPAITCW